MRTGIHLPRAASKLEVELVMHASLYECVRVSLLLCPRHARSLCNCSCERAVQGNAELGTPATQSHMPRLACARAVLGRHAVEDCVGIHPHQAPRLEACRSALDTTYTNAIPLPLSPFSTLHSGSRLLSRGLLLVPLLGVRRSDVDPLFKDSIPLAPQVYIQPGLNAVLRTRFSLHQLWADLLAFCFETGFCCTPAQAAAERAVDPVAPSSFAAEDCVVPPLVTHFAALALLPSFGGFELAGAAPQNLQAKSPPRCEAELRVIEAELLRGRVVASPFMYALSRC